MRDKQYRHLTFKQINGVCKLLSGVGIQATGCFIKDENAGLSDFIGGYVTDVSAIQLNAAFLGLYKAE